MYDWQWKRRARRTVFLSTQKKNGSDETADKIADALAALHGAVLEIGAGAGNMLKYLPQDVSYCALEPNPYLRDAILDQARQCGITSARVVSSGAEVMPFDDASFDAVCSVRSLCSVENLQKVLQEVRRVLKPGGVLLFAEHVGAPRGSFLYLFQKTANLWHQCDMARDIETAIRAAGFVEVTVEPFQSTVGKYSMLPRIMGVARNP